MPYLLTMGDDEQKARWLPGIVAGETITAVAMTEPGTGSDLAGHPDHEPSATATTGSSTARRPSSRTASTPTSSSSPCAPASDRHRGLSLLVLERGMPGFERGRKLEKIGMHAQDTAELSFTDVRVPAANLLGAEGDGFLGLDPQSRPGARVDGSAQPSPAPRPRSR